MKKILLILLLLNPITLFAIESTPSSSGVTTQTYSLTADETCELRLNSINKTIEKYRQLESKISTQLTNIELNLEKASLALESEDLKAQIINIKDDNGEEKSKLIADSSALVNRVEELKVNICDLDNPNLRKEFGEINETINNLKTDYVQIRNTYSKSIKSL